MLRPGGSIVSVVEAPNDERADVNHLLFVVEPNSDQLTELARRIESLRPVVGKVGTLPDGPRLWAEKIAGGIPGKVVLTPQARPRGETIGRERAAARPSTRSNGSYGPFHPADQPTSASPSDSACFTTDFRHGP
jgi:hypothetical protein